jgi:Zn-dependent peptidase ImmA (M78 family)
MNEPMERGFKAYATRLALDVRAELGLAALEPLDPWLLADHLEIEIDTVSSFRDEAPHSMVLGGSERAAFSAVTVLDESRRRIVVNDFHSLSRQTNSIAHELSHGLLMHPPAPPFDPRTTLRIHVPVIEQEASYLGGALLVTEAAALAVVANGYNVREAADHYGVSEELMRWRINMTGATKRVARGRRPTPKAIRPGYSAVD